MTTYCRVLIDAALINLDPAAGWEFRFIPVPKVINRHQNKLIVPGETVAPVPPSGQTEISLVPGQYQISASIGGGVSAQITIVVPDADTARLEQLIDLPAPASVDAAQQAVIDAQAARDEAVSLAQDFADGLSQMQSDLVDVDAKTTIAVDAANRAEAAIAQVPGLLLRLDSVPDDTARLNAWFAAGGILRPQADHTYLVTGPITIPNGSIIDGDLRLAYEGPNGAQWISCGNDVIMNRLRLEVPTATGSSVVIGTGYRGAEIQLLGGGGGGASAVIIANTAGLDLDRFECSGGFQRPLVLGNGADWSVGGRLGHVRVRDFTRGIGINYLDGFVLGGYDIADRSVFAGYEAGHNGLLITGLRNSYIGSGRVEGAGEHAIRLSGDPALGASYNNAFGVLDADGAGGCVIKVNPDIIAYDFRFGDVTAIGRFLTAPGGNREGARLSHCRKFTFGRFSITPADGAVWACQDVFALNDATDVSVAHIHAEGVSQSVIDITAPQDVGSGLGAGDVRRITVGGLSGSSTTSKPILRIDAIDGDHVIALSDIHVSGVDYFTDGMLVTAEALADVDGPITISGRLRKTDLTTLPTTTNMPAAMTVDMMVGASRVLASDGALVWADLPAVTPERFDGTDEARLAAFFAHLQSTGEHGVMRGVYRIATDFQITAPISLDARGSTVYQTAWPYGFIQLRAGSDGSRIANATVLEDLDSPRPTPYVDNRYRGYTEGQRHCALWVESGDNHIENVQSEGMVNTLCLRGPVAWYPAGAGYTGADTDPNTAFDYSGFADNNRVVGVFGKSQDFAVTGHQQRNLWLSDFSLRDVVETTGNPPHAVYMRSNGSGVTAGQCIGAHISDGHCYSSPDGVGHKFHNFVASSFADLSAHGASGVGNFIDCTDCSWSNVTGSDLAGDNLLARYAHNFQGCTGRVVGMHMDGVPDNTIGLLEIKDGAVASDLTVSGATAVTDFVAGNAITETVVRVEGASALRLRGLDYRALGDDARYIFTTADTATITASDLNCTGTTALANGAGGAIHLNYDAAQMAGSPLTVAGTVTTSVDEQTKRFEHGAAMTLYGTTTAGSHSYSTKRCWVERVGNRVTLSITVAVSGAFGGTGNVRFGPLPYAIADDASSAKIDERQLITTGDNITLASGNLVAALIDGADYIALQTVTGLTRANVTNTALGSNAAFQVQVEYYTTAGF